MTDKYFKCDSLSELTDVLTANNIEFPFEGEVLETTTCVGTVIQTLAFGLEWLGKVPKPLPEDAEESTPVEYYTGQRFNVRLVDQACTIFEVFEDILPEQPYRTFGPLEEVA